MKKSLISLAIICSLNIFASDINQCKSFKSPMSYQMDDTYTYDQYEASGYYRILFDTDFKPNKWDKDIEGTIRIMLLDSGKAILHYVESKYITKTSPWGDEYREQVWSVKRLSKESTWNFDNNDQKIIVDGIGEGTSAICSSENPGLSFKYYNSVGPLKLETLQNRFLYLGGANYDILK